MLLASDKVTGTQVYFRNTSRETGFWLGSDEFMGIGFISHVESADGICLFNCKVIHYVFSLGHADAFVSRIAFLLSLVRDVITSPNYPTNAHKIPKPHI